MTENFLLDLFTHTSIAQDLLLRDRPKIF